MHFSNIGLPDVVITPLNLDFFMRFIGAIILTRSLMQWIQVPTSVIMVVSTSGKGNQEKTFSVSTFIDKYHSVATLKVDTKE